MLSWTPCNRHWRNTRLDLGSHWRARWRWQLATNGPAAPKGRRMPQRALLGELSSAAHYAWRGSRLLAGFVRGRPIHCIVQVSNRCNLTCGFCSFWERPAHPQDEMTVEDFEVISAKLA